MIACAYLFHNLSSVIIDIPLLPKERISWQIFIRCKAKFAPVDNNLVIVEMFCLIDLDVPFQSFTSLGTKPIVPVIPVITNLSVY
jgi:hypothetical protein